MKEARTGASKALKGPKPLIKTDRAKFVNDIKQALYASKIVSYAQGFMLMRAAAQHYGWNLNFGSIALMWRGGCIIRSIFLGKIKEAFDKNPNLANLMLDPFFKKAISSGQRSWRNVFQPLLKSVPMPRFHRACILGWFGATESSLFIAGDARLFCAHTDERIDAKSQFFIRLTVEGLVHPAPILYNYVPSLQAQVRTCAFFRYRLIW
jgi:6-phosphogluconate dehydrogenase